MARAHLDDMAGRDDTVVAAICEPPPRPRMRRSRGTRRGRLGAARVEPDWRRFSR